MKEFKSLRSEILPIPEEIEAIGTAIVDSAYRVHKTLGPGLLEKIYEVCLCHELRKKGHNAERQVSIPINYDGITFDEGLKIDVLVDESVIIEIKAVNELNKIWEAQILSHLKMKKLRLGYLINFNTINIGKGIKRFVL